MTTERDHGGIGVRMIECPLDTTSVYRSRFLAVRDMRAANGRDPASGQGAGNESWIGLALALMILDLTRLMSGS
ncbi:MAG: hypothetical protein J0I49_31165 [Pseudonocardia sp.]|uniref:hypothetical protein n=1 Tax=Pseudonocardia sp. TaxID=60912 RepID=UPI001AC623DA|nr:hypothetical protein [Pseudonocardia sp.]MBN9102526.1 hypothetical protein [Pseudonocardia sp.]